MRAETITEKLWELLVPILELNKKKTGRPAKGNKEAFFGIFYLIENGIKWKCMPSEFGKKSTVHSKYRTWIKSGIIEILFKKAREDYLLITDAFHNWLAVDTSSCKAPYAKEGGKSPVDRGKRGIKKNIISDSKGVPLAISVAPGNMHDSKTFEEIIKQAIEVKRASIVIIAADSAYDVKRLKEISFKKGFILHTATNKRRNKNCKIIKPGGRWIVEAAHSWLNNFRGIKTCFTKTTQSFLGFLQIACCSILIRKSGVSG